MVIGKGNNMMT